MSEGAPPEDDRTVADSLRQAIERTLEATAPAASQTRERAQELLDDFARRGRELGRRGQEARDELGRRGQEARDEISRRGQEAGAEVAKQLESLEQRLTSVEELLKSLRRPDSDPKDEG
jgi:polyhydroxyalkanoate synthesis regulator phasin